MAMKIFFDLPDYIVCCCMLLAGLGVGVYFGFLKQTKNVKDYLVGDHNMKMWPVAVSLMTSYISGITFLGLPAEVYLFGMQKLYMILTNLTTALVGNYVVLPVFMNVELTSTNEYLLKRFDNSMRLFGTITVLLYIGLWLPVVIYVPALALNQATGISINVISPAVCAICIFYTCAGGIRAVIWTDFLQGGVMVGSMLLVLYKGTVDLGGVWTVIERGIAGERIEPPNMELSLTKRLTFPAVFIGGACSSLQAGILSQIMMQRFVSLPSLKEARRTMWLFVFIKTIFYTLITYVGVLLYATYHDCDPISTGIVKKVDQLLPLLVIDSLKYIPGASGLFIAGVFSASLSALSGGINSLAAVILEDIYKPIVQKVRPVTANEANIVAKCSVVLVGVVSVLLSLVVEHLGPVLQLSSTLSSISSGALLGVFMLGIVFPWANARGALIGGLTSLATMLWISLGQEYYMSTGALRYPRKPVDTSGCPANFTTIHVANMTMPSNEESEIFYPFRITFVLFTCIGMLVTIIVGLIVSNIDGSDNIGTVDVDFLTPFARDYVLRKREQRKTEVAHPHEQIHLMEPKLSIGEKDKI